MDAMELTGMHFIKMGKKIFFIFLLVLIIFGTLVKATAIPTVGGDTNNWGTVLNNYLQTNHNADGTHGNITAIDFIIKSPITDVRAFGAVGNGTADDTIAIQAAMDYVEAQGGGTLFFPRGTYLITSTINWKYGTRLEGEQGGFFNADTYPEIVWGGVENGTMLLAEQINDNWHSIDVMRLVFRGNGTNNPMTAIDFRDRVDFGTNFRKTKFANTNGDAIILRKSSTNFYMYDNSAENIGGYFLYINGSQGGIFNIDKFAYKSGTIGASDGFIIVDGNNAPNNAINRISVSNTRFEISSNISGNNDTMILLGVNPSISDYVQNQLVLDNVLLTSANGVENLSLVKSSPVSDQFTVTGTNVQVDSKDIIINGTITPGPIKGKLHPFFVFGPFVTGSPGANNELISLIGKPYITQWGIGIANFTEELAVNGSLRVQNTSGTLILYVNESTGSVGIGTARPEGNLEIAGGGIASIDLKTATKRWRFFNGAGVFLIAAVGPDVNAFRIDGSGRFGFSTGSTLPDTPVDMAVGTGGITNILKLRNTFDSANNQGANIVFSSTTSNTSLANVAGIAGVMTDNNNSRPKGAVIFYTANGTVPNEKTRLDFNGTLILASNTTSVACDATTEGGIIYSSSSKKYYGCNSTTWNLLF